MKILINTASAHKGGSVQVAYSFIRECVNIPGHSYGLIAGPSIQNLLGEDPSLEHFTIYKVDKRPSQTPLKAFYGNIFKDIEDSFRPDVVFTTSGPAYWKSQAPHLIGYNLPHYIYPESPYFNRISWKERWHWRLWKQLVTYFYNRDADALVVQTDDVKDRVRSLLKCQDVTTVHNTCGSQFKGAKGTQGSGFCREADKEYLLYLSAFYPHKNIEIINQVVPELEESAPGKFVFVLTLPEATYESAIRPEIRSQVINLGPVRPEDCPNLYLQADYSFLPTLLECFSASYVESMAMGRPILTSDMSFACTVCGDAATYFDPTDVASIKRAILSLSADKNKQEKCVKAGYDRLKRFPDPRDRANAYIEICQRIAVDRG